MSIKNWFWLLPLAGLLLLTASCGGDIPYYHQESSVEEIPESVEDSVPPLIAGENGVYDTVNDIEYVRIDGLIPKKIGKPFLTDQSGYFEVENEPVSYFICDAEGVVYKNTMMPMLSMPGDDLFEEQYPGFLNGSAQTPDGETS